MPGSIPRIALMIETSREYGRGLLRGVMQYEKEHGPWSIFFEPRGLFDPPPSWLSTWDGDGILARVSTLEMADAINAAGVPAIDLRISYHGQDFPGVGINNEEMVDLAFRHLWDQGFRNFAFCGYPRNFNEWSDFRANHMQKVVEQAGAQFFLFRPPPVEDVTSKWDRDEDEIAQWLLKLPKPVGVLACNDDRALHVLEAARRVSLQVPDEVGVMGIDNDELLCNLANPPLTSVHLGVERAGYIAASELMRLIQGKRPRKSRIMVSPLEVVERQSTNILVFEDQELARLIRELRAHACNGLRVDSLLKKSSLSESTVQRRFKALVGRSMKEEITRIRMERARQLLAHTDLPISEIAARCGFNEPKQLSTVFHKKMGITPLTYRKNNWVAKFSPQG